MARGHNCVVQPKTQGNTKQTEAETRDGVSHCQLQRVKISRQILGQGVVLCGCQQYRLSVVKPVGLVSTLLLNCSDSLVLGLPAEGAPVRIRWESEKVS